MPPSPWHMRVPPSSGHTRVCQCPRPRGTCGCQNDAFGTTFRELCVGSGISCWHMPLLTQHSAFRVSKAPFSQVKTTPLAQRSVFHIVLSSQGVPMPPSPCHARVTPGCANAPVPVSRPPEGHPDPSNPVLTRPTHRYRPKTRRLTPTPRTITLF